MNILILGEFSAFAKNLAKGFKRIGGHRVVVISDGDHFKRIEQDEDSITYPEPHNISFMGHSIPRTSGLIGIKNYLQSRKDIKQFKSYFDVVFIMNSCFIRSEKDHSSPYYSIKDINFVKKANARVFMSACGGDLAFFKFALADRRFSTVYKDKSIIENNYYSEKESLALQIVEGVIPMSFQYAEAYREYASDFHLLNAIQLPFDVNSVTNKTKYTSNDKIVIFNGSLRPTKGTVFIEEALSVIKKKYGDKIIIRNDRLPYKEFLTILPEIDLYVDLCTDYDYGMSALAAMSAGCVVLSGNEPETRREFNVDDIPVVSVSPNTEDIVMKISHFIENPSEIESVGRNSRLYVEKYHDCKLIAEKYLRVFTE